jgi:O-antigen/teichoic acid export membrane protein
MVSVQDEGHRFQRGYLGSVGLSGIMAFPLLTLLWTTADVLIPLLYGPKWAAAVPILISLSMVGYLAVASNPNGLVMKATGWVMAEAACQATFLGLTVLFVFLGTQFGIQGAVGGVGLATLIFLIIMTRLALSISGVTPAQWLRALRTPVLSSAAMAVAVLGLKAALTHMLPAALLCVTIILGGIVAYLLALRFFLVPEERQVLERVLMAFPMYLRGIVLFFIGSSSRVLKSPSVSSPVRPVENASEAN